jgi:hypothetical protein
MLNLGQTEFIMMTATPWLKRKHMIFGGAITGFEDAIDSVKANKMDRPLGIPRLLISMSSGACMLWIPPMISYWELPQP